jgi:pimeloyl-ACP methyl ester carboxylesterase
MQIQSLFKRGLNFPGFVKGSILQTISTFQSKRDFPFVPGRKNIILVPGAFCTSSVMNRLGARLAEHNFNIFLPSDIPYYYGPLANLCPLSEAARSFINDVYSIMGRYGIDEFYVVGHSNGGLIPLVALNMDIGGKYTRAFRGVITLATPFKGTDVARVVKPILPVAKDILPNRNLIDGIKGAREKIILCLQSRDDFLVPPEYQYPDGVVPYGLDGFNHMDFIVGSEKQMKDVALIIREAIDGRGN